MPQVVTGAGKGIGRAVTLMFACTGVNCGAFAHPTGLTTFGSIGKVTSVRRFACRRCEPGADRSLALPLHPDGG